MTPDLVAPARLQRRREQSAIGSLAMAIVCIPLFLLCRLAGFDLGIVFIGTLASVNSLLLCPVLMYMGFRMHSRLVLTCALAGTSCAAFWVWLMINS